VLRRRGCCCCASSMRASTGWVSWNCGVAVTSCAWTNSGSMSVSSSAATTSPMIQTRNGFRFFSMADIYPMPRRKIRRLARLLPGCSDELVVALKRDEAIGDLALAGLEAGIGGLADRPDAAIYGP